MLDYVYLFDQVAMFLSIFPVDLFITINSSDNRFENTLFLIKIQVLLS